MLKCKVKRYSVYGQVSKCEVHRYGVMVESLLFRVGPGVGRVRSGVLGLLGG